MTRTSEGAKSQTLFTLNKAGDCLLIGKTDTMRLTAKADIAHLIVNADTLHISFSDDKQQVSVNRDVYRLYPAFYTRFKQAILLKHDVMAILNLLGDNIGDYPIEAALPLLLFSPQMERKIQSARITTQRSQADVSDTWDCVYGYNKSGNLVSVSANSSEELRFSKKMRYQGNRIVSLSTYRSIETRKITDRTITYFGTAMLKWHDEVVETGKNRESEQHITLTKSSL
ncbi:MAG: hypothetical protein EOO88_54440 [Pedobacter sp.]|nr:MAG: hypothetical protein EOO88_54440 [Pedobacter sp.]